MACRYARQRASLASPRTSFLPAAIPQESAAACITAARANASYIAATWISPALGSSWALGCYARYDAGFDAQSCLDSWDASAPCYTDQEADCVSAVTEAVDVHTVVYLRDFEHLHVEYNAQTQGATLTWAQQ